MMRIKINNLLSLLLLFFISNASLANKLALVIGNDKYSNIEKLQTAGNDADSMANQLRKSGYEVTLQKNLTFFSMIKVIDDFTNKIAKDDNVLFFYAGHGVELKSGNYILPVDIDPKSESFVEKTAYSLNELSYKINESKPRFSLIIVDACRDNRLSTNKRSIGSARGLAPIEPPKGQMIVFSASKGQAALDRLNDSDPNPNSVFTRELIPRMSQPGLSIFQLIRQVQDSVEELASKVGHEQRPALYNDSKGDFYFIDPVAIASGILCCASDPFGTESSR